MRKAEYMEKHIGEEYQGLISGVHEFGIFIELDNTVEGLAKIENLPKDSYEYNEESLTLRGKKQENTFTFGNVVTVKVIGASKEAQTVDFMIINKNNKDKLEKPKIKKRIKGYDEKEEKNTIKLSISLVLLTVLSIGLGYTFHKIFNGTKPTIKNSDEINYEVKPFERKISLVMVGDALYHDGVYKDCYDSSTKNMTVPIN